MTVAAEKLFISQPTVSQAIRELEEHYGVLLFERLNRKLYITDAGKKLLSYAKTVVSQFDTLEEKMFSLNKIEKIRIGATVTVGECVLSDIINRLRNENPKFKIYSYANNTEIIEEKLLNGEIDIGIVEGKVKSNDLIVIPEIRDRLVLICGADHPFAKRKSVNIKELNDKEFAMREKGSGTRELFEDYMIKNGVDIRIAFEGNSQEAIKREVMRNNYLACVSVCLVEEEVKESKIHIIENLDGEWNRHFSVVYHKDKIMTEGMKALIKIIEGYENLPTKLECNSCKLIK